MKNETARREIESLDYYLQNHTDDYSEESHTAMMMAIKALEQEPKYCDRNICIKNEYNGISCDECEVTKSQEPKTGHWIVDRDDSRRWDKVRFYCSECGRWQTYGRTDYCPSCGCRMVEPQEKR